MEVVPGIAYGILKSSNTWKTTFCAELGTLKDMPPILCYPLSQMYYFYSCYNSLSGLAHYYIHGHFLLASCFIYNIYDMHVLKKGSPRSPQLIDIPSLALSPVAPVLFNLSEPAKI